MGFIDHENVTFQDTDITFKDYDINKVDVHSSTVASIIAGTNGFVPEAEIYNVALPASISLAAFEDAFNWYIYTAHIDVVNISLGFDNNGYYSSLDEYLDYIVTANNITIVAAAGNISETENPSNNYVFSIALARNVIAVGALDGPTNICTESSYDERIDNHVEKPNISADGSFSIDIGITFYEKCFTSYAAPYVTATVAAMIESNSVIVSKPYVINSILSTYSDSSSIQNPDITNGYENKFGAGRLSPIDSINAAANYYEGVTNYRYRGILSSEAIVLHPYDEITITLWWDSNVDYDNSNYTPYSTLDLNLELQHNSSGLLCNSIHTDYNFEKMTCTVPNLTPYLMSYDYTIHVIQVGYYITADFGTNVSYSYSYKIE